MDLGSFLADDTIGGGSWADEEVDMTSIGVPTGTAAVPEHRSFNRRDDFQGPGGSFGGGFGGEDRPERKEFPIPDEPPYKARVGNLPWDVDEEMVKSFFERRMQMHDIVTDVKLPQDHSGRLKGFGFVTFTERDVLEQALKLTLADFNGRKVFVSVAAPPKQDVFDLDWRSARSGPLGSRGPRRERGDEPDLDWGAARSEETHLPPRERSFRGPRRERGAEEPDLDWGSARSEETTLPPRDRERPSRRPRRHESSADDFDWGAARNEEVNLPPRERSIRKPRRQESSSAADFDWGAARNEEVSSPQRERSQRKPRKHESQLDWGAVRSDASPKDKEFKPQRSRRNHKREQSQEEPQPQGPQKSSYDVLTIEGESDEEAVAASKNSEQQAAKDAPSLEEATAKLSVQSKEQTNNDEGWEVVGK